MENIKLLFICFLSFAIDSCYSNTVDITGVIHDSQGSVIQLYEFDFLREGNSRSTKVDEEGLFSFSFELEIPKNISLRLNGRSTIIYLNPGDSLHIEADPTLEDIMFSGSAKEANVSLARFFDAFEYIIFNPNYFIYRDKGETDHLFEYNEHIIEKFDSLRLSLPLSNEISNFIVNFYCSWLIDQTEEHARHNAVPFEHQIYDQIFAFYDLMQSGQRSCSKFNSTAHVPIEITLRRNGLSIWGQPGLDSALSMLKLNPKLEYGAATILALNIRKNSEYAKKTFDLFIPHIRDQYLIEKLCLEKFNVTNQLEDEDLKTVDELLKNEQLASLFSQIKELSDKVVYLDFWDVTCSPCIKEFPNSTKLKNDLKAYPIEFAYLCGPSEKSRWLSLSEKYELNSSKNILLTHSELATLQSVFQFNAFPRYMIIDKDGNFIDEDATRPSHGHTKDDLIQLAKD